MSGYYFTSLSFEVRRDAPEHIVHALSSAAEGRQIEQADSARLHPIPRYYLADSRRLLANDEPEPSVGTPIRIGRTHSRMSGMDTSLIRRLSIEWVMHDDAYADYGHVFELWVLNLVVRPAPDAIKNNKHVIGYRMLYPNDYEASVISIDHHGIATRDQPYPFDEFDNYLDQALALDHWESWYEQQLNDSC